MWLGLAFGGLQIMFFVGCLRLGLNTQSRCTKALVLSGLVYVGVLAGMVIADRQYAQADNSSLLLSFPVPTALMLYGLYTVPLIFTLLYVVYYERWIVRPEDLQRFRETLKAKQQIESDG